jgi:uncharacterized protein YjbJ (UPF0337 family)
MNWDQIEGNWKLFKGCVKETRGKLTGGEIDEIAGRRGRLIGKLQECYGIAREDAGAQIRKWGRGL